MLLNHSYLPSVNRIKASMKCVHIVQNIKCVHTMPVDDWWIDEYQTASVSFDAIRLNVRSINCRSSLLYIHMVSVSMLMHFGIEWIAQTPMNMYRCVNSMAIDEYGPLSRKADCLCGIYIDRQTECDCCVLWTVCSVYALIASTFHGYFHRSVPFTC